MSEDNKNVSYKPPEGLPLSKLLLGSFEWHATTQGHNYWSEVYDNLREIEDANK